MHRVANVVKLFVSTFCFNGNAGPDLNSISPYSLNMWGPSHKFSDINLQKTHRECRKCHAAVRHSLYEHLFVGAPVRPNMVNMPKSASMNRPNANVICYVISFQFPHFLITRHVSRNFLKRL